MRLITTLCLLIATAFVGLPLVMSAMSQPRTIVVPAGGSYAYPFILISVNCSAISTHVSSLGWVRLNQLPESSLKTASIP